MLMDPMGGIVMTNDGNAILREVMLPGCLLIKLLHIIIVEFICSFLLPFPAYIGKGGNMQSGCAVRLCL